MGKLFYNAGKVGNPLAKCNVNWAGRLFEIMDFFSTFALPKCKITNAHVVELVDTPS